MDKEGYRLWTAYLKKSKSFKKYCQLINDREYMRNIRGYSQYFDEWNYYNDLNYGWFGNIHDPDWSFEDWYEGVKLRGFNIGVFPDRESVVLSTDENSLFGNHIIGEKSIIRVSIDCSQDLDTIINKIKVLIKKQVEEDGKNDFKRFEKLSLLKQNKRRLRIDSLKRYLDVYELRSQGIKWEQIINRLQTKAQKESESQDSVKRQFYDDWKKADNIIKNTELFVFPGKY